jgi:hypothetical protein
MAAKPGRFSFTLILLQALKKLTNEFRVGVAVTNLQKYIKYLHFPDIKIFGLSGFHDHFLNTPDYWLYDTRLYLASP